jgi:hypothetical protein
MEAVDRSHLLAVAESDVVELGDRFLADISRSLLTAASDPPETLRSLESNGMDAPIHLIGIDVPKWRCE